MTVNITEVISRSEQGITRPFFCRGDDNWLYYVKHKHAGYEALISEWIAGHLALKLALPIPAFRQAIIPSELINMSARDDIKELGAGIGFASQLIANADELTYIYVNQIDLTLKAKILLFDWWTSNGDRTLTEHGGNPNILWLHREYRPHIIDHNLAFDPTAQADFWQQHIFADARPLWTPAFQKEMTALMTAALADLQKWWHHMPEEWTDNARGITIASVSALLWRFQTDHDTFWQTQ